MAVDPMTAMEETLIALQRWNADLHQALERRREEPEDPRWLMSDRPGVAFGPMPRVPRVCKGDLLRRMQQKLAGDYQSIALMAHWVSLDRLGSVADLVVPDHVLDPEHDATTEAVDWLESRARRGRDSGSGVIPGTTP